MEISVASGFDPKPLQRYLQAIAPHDEREFAIEKISGGQSNPTFYVTCGARRLVVRKQPNGPLLPSAHAIDREFRVMSAISTTEVPVPRMVRYCDDRAMVGTPFYVMERVEGRVFHQCALPGCTSADRRAMYRSLAQSLAKLHNVDPAAVGLSDFGKSSNYFQRQISRWTRQWGLSKQEENPDIEWLIGWLPRNIPAGDRAAISHGDFRVGNVMFAPATSDVAAILDWELSTLGHPLADLAHFCMAWHCGAEEYGGLIGTDLVTLGIPSQLEFEQEYYRHAHHDVRMNSFHIAFALFRFAVILEGVRSRANIGNASDANAASVGRLSRVFAERAIKAARA